MHIRSRIRGISLIEVLIGTLLLTLVWLSAVGVIIVSRYSLSYSKHKIQAMYVAQRIFEEGRRCPSTDLINNATTGFAARHTKAVSIDTNGTQDIAANGALTLTADDFMGNSVTQVTPLTDYGGSIGYRYRIDVEINWVQMLGGTNKTMREHFATDITSEDVLN